MRRTADVRGGDGGGAVRSGRTTTGAGLAARVHDTRDEMTAAVSRWLARLAVMDGAAAVRPSTQQWPPLAEIRASDCMGIADVSCSAHAGADGSIAAASMPGMHSATHADSTAGAPATVTTVRRLATRRSQRATSRVYRHPPAPPPRPTAAVGGTLRSPPAAGATRCR